MRNAHACRVDANQQDIVDAMRRCGATVQLLNRVGDGCPDLLVGIRRVNLLVEVKTDWKQSLKDDQKKWHEEWRGQVCTIYSVEDAVNLINSVR